jgi:hypothetical protein
LGYICDRPPFIQCLAHSFCGLSLSLSLSLSFFLSLSVSFSLSLSLSLSMSAAIEVGEKMRLRQRNARRKGVQGDVTLLEKFKKKPCNAVMSCFSDILLSPGVVYVVCTTLFAQLGRTCQRQKRLSTAAAIRERARREWVSKKDGKLSLIACCFHSVLFRRFEGPLSWRLWPNSICR